MPGSNKSPDLHPGNAVIAKLYSAVLDNSNLPELFNAWDQFIDEIFKKNPEEAKLWQALLSEHFEQAGPLIRVNQPSLAEEKQAFIDQQTFPAILFNAGFRVVAKNQQAHDIWPAELDADISASALPPFQPKRILALQDHMDHPDPILMSLDIGSAAQPQIVMAVIHPVEFLTRDGARREMLFILRIAKPNWREELGRMLSTTYGLTEAEIEITRALYQNQNLNIIAEKRGRSIRTVRTQLSNIFDKTRASSQTVLIGMISNLGQILDFGNRKEPTKSIAGRVRDQDVAMRILTCKSAQGHSLSYGIYGAKGGKPILSLQPTVPPEMSARFRDTAAREGLTFIAPFKPGSGQSSSRNYTYTPNIAAQDFKQILASEGIHHLDVLGLNSGGVFALKFAEMFPENVASVTLCDTGVPLRSRADFLQMSKTARRTFLPARFFPSLLLTPHKMVAKEFAKSRTGQTRIVNYFFEGSSIDHALVNSNTEYYEITRDIIRYSFEDVGQLVDNVCLWASDWSPLLRNVLTRTPVHFLHGEHNDVFSWKKVDRFARENANANAKIMPNQSQLGIFTHPEYLIDLLIG